MKLIFETKKLFENLKKKNYKAFWNDVTNTSKHNMNYPTKIDGKSTDTDICNHFSSEYKSIFNKSKNHMNLTSFNLTNKKKVEILLRFTHEHWL